MIPHLSHNLVFIFFAKLPCRKEISLGISLFADGNSLNFNSMHYYTFGNLSMIAFKSKNRNLQIFNSVKLTYLSQATNN